MKLIKNAKLTVFSGIVILSSTAFAMEEGPRLLFLPRRPGEQLFDAVKKGNIEKVTQLIADGHNVNVHCSRNPFRLTPLHAVDNHDIAKTLIAAGAKVNARDIFGETPLHEAVKWKRIQVAKVLIAAGACINIQDMNGKTPLDLAIFKKHKDLEKVLRDAGAQRGAN